MTSKDLITALSSSYPQELSRDLVDEYAQMRCDLVTGSLCRCSPGKFVESFVQLLEFLSTGVYSAKPDVDKVLLSTEQNTSVDEGLRICAARIGRGVYALRNKRGIIHKSVIDPNVYDLEYTVRAAQWILTELLRHGSRISMTDAGKLISLVQTPIGYLVEDIGKKRIVLVDCSAREEILILLRSYYPEGLATSNMIQSLDRLSEVTVRNSLRALWNDKLVDNIEKRVYRLTLRGLEEASKVVQVLQAA